MGSKNRFTHIESACNRYTLNETDGREGIGSNTEGISKVIVMGN